MRKYIVGTVLTIAMAFVMVGCGKSSDDETTATTTEATTEATSETTSEATTEDNDTTDVSSTEVNADVLSAQSIADEILNGGKFSETLQPLSQEVALARLYSLDDTQIAEAAFYTNSQATAEEIAVVKTTNADYVESVKAAFELRVADQKEACVDYLPDEMPKLEAAVIYTNDCYVILTISADSSVAESIIADMFK